MPAQYDAIIIGAGLGGLTCGAKLAKEGQKVLVLEQHSVVGGCATTFRRGDYRVEAGLHMIDGFDEVDPKDDIFADLGVADKVRFVRAPEFYRYVHGGTDITVPFGVDKAIDALSAAFPGERQGIERLLRSISRMREEMLRFPQERWKVLLRMPLMPVLYPNLTSCSSKTAAELLDKHLSDDELKLVLTANVAYYHDDPLTLSALWFGVAQAGYINGGGHFVAGGSQRLSDALADAITDNGGEVRCGQRVTTILTEGDSAVGVRYSPTTADGDAVEAWARKVVANAAVPQVAKTLLEGRPAEHLSGLIRDMEIAPGLFSVYLGFTKPLRDIGSTHYSTFVYDEAIKSMSDVLAFNREDFSRRPYTFVDYGQIDSGLAPEGKGMGVICTVDRASDWSGLSRDEYRERKKHAQDALVARLDKLIPGSKELIDYCESATPLTVQRYTWNAEGTAYGFANIPQQQGMKRLRRVSPVKNLHFASAWTQPGGGFTAAIFSGYLCAGEVLRG